MAKHAFYKLPDSIPGDEVKQKNGLPGQCYVDLSFGGRHFVNLIGEERLAKGRFVMAEPEGDFGLNLRSIPEGAVGSNLSGYSKPKSVAEIADDLGVSAFLPGFYARCSEAAISGSCTTGSGGEMIIEVAEGMPAGSCLMVASGSRGSTIRLVRIPDQYAPDQAPEYQSLEEWISMALADKRTERLGVSPRVSRILCLMGLSIEALSQEGKAREWAIVDGPTDETVCKVSFWSSDGRPIKEGSVVRISYESNNCFAVAVVDETISSTEQLVSSWDEAVERMGVVKLLKTEPLIDKPIHGNVRVHRC